MNLRRAAADPITLGLVALIALGVGVFGGTWKPFEVFRPKPPTAELTRLQGQLDAAQQAAEQAKKDREAAVAAERAKLEQEIRAAQVDNAGTVAALGRVPPPHRTAEVKLAGAMAQRVTLKLAAAIGELPREQQAAMIALIDQALSDKQAEVDEANRKLAAADAAFALLARERDAVKAQIPVLEARAVKAAETVKQVEAKVAEKTEEVKVFAAKADAKAREHGSLGAAFNRAIFWGCVAVGGYFFLTFILPGLIKFLDAGPLKSALRNVAGYLTNPLLYHDAKKKLAEANARLTNAPFPK